MNKEKLQELMINPGSMHTRDLEQLQQIIKDYPYFQNAHLLLLYGLHQKKSDKFEEQLKQSALFLSSRAFLVNAIIYGWPSQNEKSGIFGNIPSSDFLGNVEIYPDIIAEEELIASNSTQFPDVIQTEETITDDFNKQELSFEESMPFSLEDAQPIELLEKKDNEEIAKQDSSSDLLDFDLSSVKPDDEPDPDLIDQFLKINPRIVPRLDMEDTRGDISIPGLEETDEIVTETLAEIYEQQGHFLKAKGAYQKLILKFPEKSAYFASRIEELDKLIK